MREEASFDRLRKQRSLLSFGARFFYPSALGFRAEGFGAPLAGFGAERCAEA